MGYHQGSVKAVCLPYLLVADRQIRRQKRGMAIPREPSGADERL